LSYAGGICRERGLAGGKAPPCGREVRKALSPFSHHSRCQRSTAETKKPRRFSDLPGLLSKHLEGPSLPSLPVWREVMASDHQIHWSPANTRRPSLAWL